MPTLTNVIGSLQFPLVVAPMAGGPTTVALVAAAANSGCLGFLAGGYQSVAALTQQMRDAHGSGAYGVNLFAPCADEGNVSAVETYRQALATEYERISQAPPDLSVDAADGWDEKIAAIQQALDNGHGPAVFSTTFGLPSADLIQDLQDRGCEVWVTVSCPNDAVVAAERGADALIIQGPEAGGHRSTTRVSQEPDDLPLEDLVRAVAESVPEIPLVAAGGIGSGDKVAKALAWPGVCAVSCGTAFLAADEAGTSRPYRQALLNDPHAETVVTRAFSGLCARGVANEFVRTYSPVAPAAYPQVNALTKPIRSAAAEAGDASRLSLWAGTDLAHIEPGPTAQIIERLTSS